MKKEISLFLLLALFLLYSAVEASAQNKSYITVTGSQLNSGVLILDIVRTSKAYRLQCNWGASGCTTLKNDKYLMVELPEKLWNVRVQVCGSVSRECRQPTEREGEETWRVLPD